MDILYLLIPLSALLVLAILGMFGWAVEAGQFEDLDGEAERILADEGSAFDEHQRATGGAPEQSSPASSDTERGP
jgi:cbb3-type cytochrome oxidase maturation protein